MFSSFILSFIWFHIHHQTFSFKSVLQEGELCPEGSSFFSGEPYETTFKICQLQKVPLSHLCLPRLSLFKSSFLSDSCAGIFTLLCILGREACCHCFIWIIHPSQISAGPLHVRNTLLLKRARHCRIKGHLRNVHYTIFILIKIFLKLFFIFYLIFIKVF